MEFEPGMTEIVRSSGQFCSELLMVGQKNSKWVETSFQKVWNIVFCWSVFNTKLRTEVYKKIVIPGLSR